MFLAYYDSSTAPQFGSGDGQARIRWYGVGLYPSAAFDGELGPAIEHPDSFYPVYRDMIDAARSQTTGIEMALDTLATGVDSAALHIGVRITPTDSSVNQAGILRLLAVVYEDSLPYEFIGETLYARTVVREVVGDSLGLPLQLRFGDEFETTLVVPRGDWQLDKLGCAVFVQDTLEKQVLQSVGKHRIPVMVGGKQ